MKIIYHNQKCADHALWQKNLLVAHYLLFVAGVIIGIFMGQFLLGACFFGGALVIYIVTIHLEAMHIIWHVRQDEDKE